MAGEYLIVGGITVFVKFGTGKELEPIEIGSASRAFAGNERSTIRATKRNWSATALMQVRASADALVAVMANGAYITCSGLLLGASFTCRGKVTGLEDDISGAFREVSFTLTQK